METIAKIRRRHEVNGESISEIARCLNLSRNTVRKYLNQSDPPRYQRKQQPKPRLGAYEDQLKTWLEQDSQRPRKQRRTARRLFEDLQTEGYVGAYDSVQRFVKRWKQTQPTLTQTFVPLVFPAGDAAQFDWSHEQVELGGVVQTIKLAHFRLAHSRQPFLVAYSRESLEMIFDAHDRAFAFWGGIPQRMIYDNPRTLVDAVKVGKQRRFNRQFLALANHYLFEPVACTPASGWEKGQVENQVGNVREWLFSPRPRFRDLAELNAWLEQQCREKLAQRPHPDQRSRTIGEVFTEEQAQLRPVGKPFAGYVEKACRVASTCTVGYDRNRYSVPAEYAGQGVFLRATATQIKIVQDGKPLASHERCFGREQQILDPWHYLPVLERKPGALRNGAPFVQWDLPAPVRKVRDHLLKQDKGDRAFVEILLAMKTHGSELLSVACELALEHKTLNAAVVLNHVNRLKEPQPVRENPVPDHLCLQQEPQANCGRYDRLREVHHGQ